MEILAPVGSTESLKAAVYGGADAVYLGMQNFNARRQADNFNASSLKEAILLCRKNGVKVYAALNTIVFEDEYKELYETVEEIAGAGVDGVIVQDWGVLELLKRAVPEMPIHASTQMSVHNLEGALYAAETGVKRVILARELSLDSIKYITENCGIETEVFIHGALCFCLSGQCYMSSAIGGRSGNRGLCAQPCRLPFYCRDRERCGLSLKDMSGIRFAKELQNIGVASLKIEGRMKRPEYVAAAIRALKSEIADGEEKKEDFEILSKVFSRSGFTDGYFTGKTGEDMFGVRTKEDAAEPTLLRSIHAFYARQPKNIAVAAQAEFVQGKKLKIAVSDGKFEAVKFGKVPQKAETAEISEEDILNVLKKTGDTPFYLENVKIECGQGLFMPLGEINAVRREAQEDLLRLRTEAASKKYDFDGKVFDKFIGKGVIRTECFAKEIPMVGKFEKAEQISEYAENVLERICIPVKELKNIKIKDVEKVCAILSRFADEAGQYDAELDEVRKYGINCVECGNIGAVYAAKRRDFEIILGFGMNVANSAAVDFWSGEGVSGAEISFECAAKDIKKIYSDIPIGTAVYGRLPLMISKNCPIKAEIGCGACGKNGVLKDRTGAEFKVLCGGGYVRILNSVPLYLADKPIPKTDFVSLYFTVENRDECDEIIRKYINSEKSGENITRGMYFRNVK